MSKYIVNIADPSMQDIRLAGGKGASLSRLTGVGGTNVPEGYIVTTDAYKAFAEPIVRPFSEKLSGALHDPASLSEEIKTAISAVALSPDFEAELKTALSAMGDDTLFAVRSSATAEDLTDASFAGQQDSFLNVRGFDGIKSAIISCCASLYNERAISYRAKNRFDENDVSMAVVIQKMVNASAAGVMFTADPMSSDRMTVMIEAVEGLGEELVSGRRVPATYSVKGGAVEKKGKEDVLTEDQIRRLSEIGKVIEKEYGCPQDIEWAIENDVIHIVQSRAITTLYPLPPSHDGFDRCYVSVGHMQAMTDVMLPLGMSFWGYMSDDVKMENVGGRIYMDVTHNLSSAIGRQLIIQKMSNSDELMYDALKKVWSRKQYLRSIPKGKASKFALPKTIVPAILAGRRAYRRNDPAMINAYEQRMEQSINKTSEHLSKLSGKAAIEFVRDDMRTLMKDLMAPEGLGPLLITFYQTKSIDKAGKELLGHDSVSTDICKWLGYNITSEMGRLVSRIADAARGFSEVVSYLENAGDAFDVEQLRTIEGGDLAADEFEIFFQRFGMRCPGEIDITKPRFAEQPSKLLPSVIADIRLPEGFAEQKLAQGKLESDRAVNELVTAAKEKWGTRKAKRLEKKVTFYRNFLGLRESPKYFWMKRYWLYKQAILREAEALAGEGKLRSAQDVYYMSLDDLLGLYDGLFEPDYAKIDSLREDYRHWETLTPPRLIFSGGEVVTGKYKREIPEGALPGIAVSNGTIEGRARVILDIKDAHRIEKGDILVTKFTDPSWTPAFMSIAALVTEIGGMATHGAVITREYGLPAVVGAVNATKLIKDGQRIRVNGAEGYVELL